ncbi:hypothetical protein [Curtobacterium sp. MCSS17_016]|uniref:hypothetical protein n=1 Tax=Curtobacterium sp. MCSS17_016 TaxID=2175644 RepID=UPI0024E0194A|nr:hypothetical protein [Curtobacterium sp. MCSS17_016]WIE81444.1 hypothetical protein DEJ19_019605 [Curtobacterium sp. MCSS17_016]
MLGLFLVGPAALYEVRDAGGTVTVPAADLRETLGIGGRDYQEMHETADRLHASGDPSWVQLPYGGVIRDD